VVTEAERIFDGQILEEIQLREVRMRISNTTERSSRRVEKREELQRRDYTVVDPGGALILSEWHSNERQQESNPNESKGRYD